jgi:hypothetical protein
MVVAVRMGGHPAGPCPMLHVIGQAQVRWAISDGTVQKSSCHNECAGLLQDLL